ncbi:hypothetical protein EDD90_9009 [Streptomyces sp. Ag109_O5-1]|nr:hypothetical protein EDD90_9009 [Streptomyces sp. Ag109_O5-1]
MPGTAAEMLKTTRSELAPDPNANPLVRSSPAAGRVWGHSPHWPWNNTG